MKSYKIVKIVSVLFLALLLFSCKKENPAPVQFVLSGAEDWNTVKNGEYLKVTVGIDYANSASELSVEWVDCFLGNRKIATEKGDKCEVYYKIEDAPIGRHEFKVAALVRASGYDKTYAAGVYDVNVEQ